VQHKTATIILLSFVLLVGLGAVALTLVGHPGTLFTDNITATGTTLAVTQMEHELLGRLRHRLCTVCISTSLRQI
jgi:hypothetical protein